MRKHDVRKWLHAILDLLPVILIPVFMIYSHRHDVSSTSTYTEEVPVYYNSNEVTSTYDLQVGNIYTFISDGSNRYDTFFSISIGDYYLINGSLTSIVVPPQFQTPYICRNDSSVPSIQLITDDFSYVTSNVFTLDFVFNGSLSTLGNVATYISQCDRQYIKEYQTVTYDFNKDIMGAFVSNFNFTIDKYFNMGNVFNLNGVYQWFNTNIFGGNAPTIIYSIWNIALYELVMDLLFLLYGLFMWFIDIVENIMNKPFKSIK